MSGRIHRCPLYCQALENLPSPSRAFNARYPWLLDIVPTALPYLAVLRRNCTSLRVTIVIVFCIASTPRNIGAPLHLVIARDLSLLSDSTLAWPSTHAPPCQLLLGFYRVCSLPFHKLGLSCRYVAYVSFYSLSLVLVAFGSQVFFSLLSNYAG